MELTIAKITKNIIYINIDKLLIAIAVKSNYHKRYETQNSGFIKLRQRSQICLTFNLLMVRYLIFHFYELTSYGHIDYKSFFAYQKTIQK